MSVALQSSLIKMLDKTKGNDLKIYTFEKLLGK